MALKRGTRPVSNSEPGHFRKKPVPGLIPDEGRLFAENATTH
jgi:hypothetical protein